MSSTDIGAEDKKTQIHPAAKYFASKINKSFGISNTPYYVTNLRLLMGMEHMSPVFRDIQDNLLHLRKKHMKIDQPGSNQLDAIQAIEGELKSAHTVFAEGDEAGKYLYFSIRVILLAHNMAHSSWKKQTNTQKGRSKKPTLHQKRTIKPSGFWPQGKATRTPPSSPRKKTSSTSRMKPVILLSRRIVAEHAQSSPSPAQCRNTNPRIAALPDDPLPFASTSSTAFSQESKHPTVTNLSLDISSKRNGEGPSFVSQGSTISDIFTQDRLNLNQPESPTPSPALSTPGIHHFLATCKPPMVQHLHRFSGFGFESHEYLHGVASWSLEQRYKLLKKILYSEPEMDIAILENHFETYFAED